MTNEQKRSLRWAVRHQQNRSDAEIAADIGCAASTVKKYRRVM